MISFSYKGDTLPKECVRDRIINSEYEVIREEGDNFYKVTLHNLNNFNYIKIKSYVPESEIYKVVLGALRLYEQGFYKGVETQQKDVLKVLGANL